MPICNMSRQIRLPVGEQFSKGSTRGVGGVTK